MPVPVLPTRAHWGEWSNYIGKVIVELIKASNLQYVAVIPDDQVLYGFTEEPLSYPNIYVYPMSDPMNVPFISGDIEQFAMSYIIIVEGQSPQLVETDDELRLIMGDIIALISLNKTLTYNSSPTVRDCHFTSIDAEYMPPSEVSADIRRWVMATLVCEKKLDFNTVTS